jgi:hypothetical protein
VLATPRLASLLGCWTEESRSRVGPGWGLPRWRRCAAFLCLSTLLPAFSSLSPTHFQCLTFSPYPASHLLQVAAIPLLDPAHVKTDRIALQRHFKAKRDHVLDRLEKMGFDIPNRPTSTFYIWLPLANLPTPLNNGLTFFEELLKEKVIVVPGSFFDLSASFPPSLHELALTVLSRRPFTSVRHRSSRSPTKLTFLGSRSRNLMDSPCNQFVRLSYGPPLEELDRGSSSFLCVPPFISY